MIKYSCSKSQILVAEQWTNDWVDLLGHTESRRKRASYDWGGALPRQM